MALTLEQEFEVTVTRRWESDPRVTALADKLAAKRAEIAALEAEQQTLELEIMQEERIRLDLPEGLTSFECLTMERHLGIP